MIVSFGMDPYIIIGTKEPNMERYFRDKIFPCSTSLLKRTNRLPIVKRAVLKVRSKFKVNSLILNILYNYDYNIVFP